MKKTDVQTTESTTVIFPSAPDADGYFFENEDEKEMGIQTRLLKNGNRTKTATLRDGKVYVVRELTGRDTKSIARYQGKDQERFLSAACAVATTVDGQPETFEFFEGMKLKDLNKIHAMYSELNF